MKNKPFDKMTAAEKRVAIAEDVILQLGAGRYRPNNCYVEIDGVSKINQETVKSAPRCNVCAIGAALVSGIRLGNRLSFKGDWLCQAQTQRNLSTWFSSAQIRSMETAFEGYGPEPKSKEIDFYEAHCESQDRMTAIFRNIITNKGTFKP